MNHLIRTAFSLCLTVFQATANDTSPPNILFINADDLGWGDVGFMGSGYPRKAFRDLSHYTRKRMVTHLNRRSQRKYHRPKGMSHYQYLQELGLQSL